MLSHWLTGGKTHTHKWMSWSGAWIWDAEEMITSWTSATRRLAELKVGHGVFVGVSGGQWRGPALAISPPSRRPSFLASNHHQPSLDCAADQQARLPQPHPNHEQGQGPFLVLLSTRASQLQPWTTQAARLPATRKRRWREPSATLKLGLFFSGYWF